MWVVTGPGLTVCSRMIHQERERVLLDPGLRSVFVNPRTGEPWEEGDVYTCPALGKTLRAICNTVEHGLVTN